MHITVFFFNSFVTIVHVPTILLCEQGSSSRSIDPHSWPACYTGLRMPLYMTFWYTGLATIKLIISQLLTTGLGSWMPLYTTFCYRPHHLVCSWANHFAVVHKCTVESLLQRWTAMQKYIGYIYNIYTQILAMYVGDNDLNIGSKSYSWAEHELTTIASNNKNGLFLIYCKITELSWDTELMYIR